MATHIRNAFAHTHIIKGDSSFTMHDEYQQKIKGKKKKIRTTTMRGIIDVDLMPKFLQAIKENYRIRGEKNAKQKTKATAVAES